MDKALLKYTALVAALLVALVCVTGWQHFSDFFVEKPVHCWMVAVGFGVLGVMGVVPGRSCLRLPWKPLLLTSAVWVGYGFWEGHAAVMKWNIRADLVMGWPVLFGGSVLVIALALRSLATCRVKPLAIATGTDSGFEDK